MDQICQNSSKWLKVVQYDPKLFKIVIYSPKLYNMVQKSQNGPIQSNIFQNNSNWSKINSKWYNDCSNCSIMVQVDGSSWGNSS